jgi:hypothetical protein
VVGPGAVGCGVAGWAEAGEGLEVVGEVGLVVVAAGKGELGPVDVGSAVEELDGLLEALDAAVELGGDADLLAEELGEAAGADAEWPLGRMRSWRAWLAGRRRTRRS